MDDYTPPGHEKLIADRMGAMNPADPQSMVFSMSTYEIYDEEAATAVLAYANEDSDFGLVMWNLGPGQENDYHVHPNTEHLHVVVRGEVEYTLDGGPPVTLRVGDAVMVPAKVPHGIRNVSDEPASYLAVAGTRGGYEKVLVDRPQR